MLDLTNLKVIKELLRQAGLRPSKDLGQNFLISQKAVRASIEAADLEKTDTILEIGPGLGVLTFELARRAKQVIAVEKDLRMCHLLEQTLEERAVKNVQIVNKDILKFSIFNPPAGEVGSQASNPKFDSPNSTYKIVSNLPYQITSPVLWKFLHEAERKPALLVLMMQQEVAERIVAAPGQMSLLSVLVQYYAEAKIVAKVKRTSFYPVPKVASAIVALSIKDKRAKSEIDEDKFFKLVRIGFANKRKMLKNNLNISVAQLVQAGLSENSRAQELVVSDWLRLYEVVYNDN